MISLTEHSYKKLASLGSIAAYPVSLWKETCVSQKLDALANEVLSQT